jgi:hypothetical protein
VAGEKNLRPTLLPFSFLRLLRGTSIYFSFLEFAAVVVMFAL